MIETERLRIHIATQEEMTEFIARQTDDVLKTACREMLQGSIDHPEQREWFAIWMIESKEGIHMIGRNHEI